MSEENTEISTVDQTGSAILLDVDTMSHMMNVATFMSKANQLPAHLRNPADCLAVVMQAAQWGMQPFAIASQTYSVNGQLAYGAQLINAVVTRSGQLKSRFNYEWFGEWEKILGRVSKKTSAKGNDYYVADWAKSDEKGLGIRISAILKGEDEPRTLEILLSQVTVRNSPLWAEDPKQQIAYLATKRWSRLHMPDAILGVYSPDELDPNFGYEARDVNEAPNKDMPKQSPTEAAESQQEEHSQETALFQKLADIANKEGVLGYEIAWKKLTKDQRNEIGAKNHGELKKLAKAYDEAHPPIDQDGVDQFKQEMEQAEQDAGN